MPVLPEQADRLFVDDHCASCLAPLPLSAGGLFCDDLCAQVASVVRYARGVYSDGRLLDPDVRYAISIRTAHLLAGGYDERARTIPPDVRAHIIERDHGLCVQCGKPGVEIDHIAVSSFDEGNLQLLCVDCHHAKTALGLRPASPDQQTALKELHRFRIFPAAPVLLADDEKQWSSVERTLRAARRRRLIEQVADLGVDAVHPRRPWAQVMAELDELGVHDPAPVPVTQDDDSTYGPDSYFARSMTRDD